MVVPALPHEVKACWGYFTLSWIQLLSVYVQGTICRDNILECSGRSHDVWLRFSLQFAQCRKEAANSLPVLKPWQNSFMHLDLSHCRCHGQQSRSCLPNLSCNHFNQSCSSKGKVTRALFCLMRPHETKQALPYIKQNLQATCLYVTVEFAILRSQGRVRIKYFYDLRRSSGGGAKLFGGGADAESKKWDSVHLCCQLDNRDQHGS